MRWAVLLLALAGCLDEPDAPPGHGYEMRDDVLVADLDGDTFDDLVTWGHDGDPRQTAEVFVRWGGSRLSDEADQTIHIPTSQPDGTWHEVIAVAFVENPPQLVVVSGDDLGPPPDGKNRRAIQIWTLPVSGKNVGAPTATLTTELLAYGLGGYTRSPSPAFVAPYRPASAPMRVLLGDGTRLLDGPLGSDPASDVMLTFSDNEVLGNVFTIPPATGVATQDPLFITNQRTIQVSQLQDPLPAGRALPPRGTVIASARRISSLWATAIEPNGNTTTISIVKIDDNASPLEVYRADYGKTAEHLSMVNFNYAKGTMGIASIFNGHISIAYGITFTDPVSFADDAHVDIDAQNDSVLAVGHFFDQEDEIMTFDATNRAHRPTCWRYNETTHTVDEC